MSKPAVLVARAVFPETLEKLARHFEVESNPADTIWPAAELGAKLRGKAGCFITGSERIDAAMLDANPQLRAVCNMAVGYNNIDVDACTARGVLATNTPDVLTETTADFGFALMMATARRMALSRFSHSTTSNVLSRASARSRNCSCRGSASRRCIPAFSTWSHGRVRAAFACRRTAT